MSEEKKKGTMSIKNGRLLMSTDSGEVEIDLSYIKSDMRRAIRATQRNSLYVQFTKDWINQLDNAGLRAIPSVMRGLGTFIGKKESSGFSFGGKSSNVVDFRTNVLSSGDNNFLNSTFGIKVNKPSFNKKKKEKPSGLGTELLAKACFNNWYQNLNMIKFGSNNKKPKEDPNKKYSDNFEKAFKEPVEDQQTSIEGVGYGIS